MAIPRFHSDRFVAQVARRANSPPSASDAIRVQDVRYLERMSESFIVFPGPRFMV